MYSFIDVVIDCLNYVHSVALSGAAFNPSWHLTAVAAAVAQLWSLSGIERFDFMKTQRLITWSAILAVAGLAYWLVIPEPPAPLARVKVEGDTAQISAAHSVCNYDYYFIPQNRTPEVAVRLH